MPYFKILISCSLAWMCLNVCQAQETKPFPGFYENLQNSRPDSTSKLKISSIHISGNRTTKNYIILREIPFKTGDSLLISQLYNSLEQARVQVYNINLFSEVSVTPVMVSADEIALNFTVREKWYIYPTPQFQLVDRNFNVWWKTYNADFSRVIYGVKFVHYNFSGRSDQLRIYLLNGYSRNISFSYTAPYSNAKLTEGFSVSAGYTQNREISYKTNTNDSVLNYRKEGFVRNTLYANISYQVRRGFFKRHLFSAGYSHVNVDDSIIDKKYNPNYFNLNKSSVDIVDLSYNFSYSNTDNINYPLKGQVYGIGILKRGLQFTGGINMLSLSGAYRKYITHPKQWYSVGQLYGKIVLPLRQAYINQRALGYSDFFLRGLEYYAIDGVAAAVAKYTLKKKILSFNINLPFHIRALPRIPFAFYGKVYSDVGYSYIQKEFETKLNNKMLYTTGVGMDVISVYDAVFAVEYSFNQLGENGLFLHAKLGF